MTADPTDTFPPLAALDRTEPGRRRAYIPDRPPPPSPFGTADAMRDLAEADVRARSMLPKPPPGFHWTPRIEPDRSLVEGYARWGTEVHEGAEIGARLVYRLERDAR